MYPFIKEYGIDAIIITDYGLAKYIHNEHPEIELQTSCNCFQWNLKQMEYWENNCGIKVFNPPREAARMPHLLKEMHDSGYIIKLLINESCLFGCPQTYNHCMDLACDNRGLYQCLRGDISNVFKGNFVLPRWLKYYDDYVDIYKIAGRTFNLKRLTKTIKAYINESDDEYYNTIICHRNNNLLNELDLKIPTSIIPDKVMSCECKNCNKCNLCKKTLHSYITNLHNNKYEIVDDRFVIFDKRCNELLQEYY